MLDLTWVGWQNMTEENSFRGGREGQKEMDTRHPMNGGNDSVVIGVHGGGYMRSVGDDEWVSEICNCSGKAFA